MIRRKRFQLQKNNTCYLIMHGYNGIACIVYTWLCINVLVHSDESHTSIALCMLYR